MPALPKYVYIETSLVRTGAAVAETAAASHGDRQDDGCVGG